MSVYKKIVFTRLLSAHNKIVVSSGLYIHNKIGNVLKKIFNMFEAIYLSDNCCALFGRQTIKLGLIQKACRRKWSCCPCSQLECLFIFTVGHRPIFFPALWKGINACFNSTMKKRTGNQIGPVILNNHSAHTRKYKHSFLLISIFNNTRNWTVQLKNSAQKDHTW